MRGGEPGTQGDRADGFRLPAQFRTRQRTYDAYRPGGAARGAGREGRREAGREAGQVTRAAGKKKAANGGFFAGSRSDQAMALTAAARRLLSRDALFLCTMRLSAVMSITFCAALKESAATALSPPVMALRTALIAVRRRECRLELRAFSLMPWRARLSPEADRTVFFFAFAVVAMMIPPIVCVFRGELGATGNGNKPAIIANSSHLVQGS